MVTIWLKFTMSLFKNTARWFQLSAIKAPLGILKINAFNKNIKQHLSCSLSASRGIERDLQVFHFCKTLIQDKVEYERSMSMIFGIYWSEVTFLIWSWVKFLSFCLNLQVKEGDILDLILERSTPSQAGEGEARNEMSVMRIHIKEISADKTGKDRIPVFLRRWKNLLVAKDK